MNDWIRRIREGRKSRTLSEGAGLGIGIIQCDWDSEEKCMLGDTY